MCVIVSVCDMVSVCVEEGHCLSVYIIYLCMLTKVNLQAIELVFDNSGVFSSIKNKSETLTDATE